MCTLTLNDQRHEKTGFLHIVQSLYFLNTKFQVSSHLLWLYSPVCVGPGRKPEDRISHNLAQMIYMYKISFYGEIYEIIP